MHRILIIALLAVALSAQAQDPHAVSQHGSYHVAGTVVSSVDGHLLQRATVELVAEDSSRSVIDSTTSDEYGRFAFTSVSGGNYVLRGKARNYLSTEYDQHEGFTTGIVTGAGVDTESLVLRLIPQAVIAGAVRDEIGDPVPGAIVRLFRQVLGQGDGRVEIAGFAPTDDRGRFEFTRLEPGSYFLVVMGRPWYATFPPPEQRAVIARTKNNETFVLQPGSNTGVVSSIDPVLEVAYSAEFYPGTTDPAAAAPIHLRGGDSFDLSFSLSAVPSITITIPIANGKSPERQMMLSFHGQSIPVNSEERQMNGQTTLIGIAPGDYTLYQPNGASPFNFGTPIHITDSTTLEDQLPNPAHLHVVVHLSDGSPLPAQLQLLLVRTNSSDEVSAPVRSKGEVTLEAPPGDYIVQIASRSSPVSIREITSGAKRLADNTIHLAADETAEISISAGKANHVVNGFARSNGKPFAGAFVLMLPFDQPIVNSRVVRDQTNLDGSFQLPGVAPGTYTLLAIDGGWDVDWRRPEVLARYLRGAMTVHVADSAEKSQTLREPLAVQPR